MIASSEPRAEKIILPNLEGMEMHNARLALERLGAARVRTHYVESYEADFTVIRQSPLAGDLFDLSHEVVLTVARRSLTDFLPQIYHQPEEDQASFLKNVLYIVQTLQDRVSMRLDTVHELFDPRTTEPEFLPWLASWLAITLSPEWDDLERRKMLRAATELFPHRGTARAIERFVEIYTGNEVEVIENDWPYAGFRIGVGSTVGTDTVILPTMNLAHCFVVRIGRPAEQVGDEEIIKIHQIIGAQKPAHTSYFLAFGDSVGSGDMDVFMEVGEVRGIGVIGVPEADEEPPAAAPETGDESGGDGGARASRSASTRASSENKKAPAKKTTAKKRAASAKKKAPEKAPAKRQAGETASAEKAKPKSRPKRSSRAKKTATPSKTRKSETQD